MPDTARGFTYPPLDGSTATNVPGDIKALADDVDGVGAKWIADCLYAAIPAAAALYARCLVYATDARAVFRCDGVAWTPLNNIETMTTVQRGALVAGGVWAGRVIENSTNAYLEVYTGVVNGWQPARSADLATAAGDTFYASAAGVLARLPKGTDGQVLTLAAGLPAWAASTVVVLGNTVLGVGASPISFSSIPATFDALTILLIGRTNQAISEENVLLRFNGDTGANYWIARNYQNASANPVASTADAQSAVHLGYVPASTAAAGYVGVARATIPGYAGTVLNKAALTELAGFETGGGMAISGGGGWKNTAAINAVSLTPASGGSFIAGTRALLLGIKGA